MSFASGDNSGWVRNQSLHFTFDKYNIHVNKARTEHNIKNKINNKLAKNTLPTSISKFVACPPSFHKKLTCVSTKPGSTSHARMTTSVKVSRGTRKSDKSGPNHSGHVGSHRESLQNKDVSDRLNKITQYNALCGNTQGTYPTPGQLIMSSGFGRPSKSHSYTTDVHFDHLVLPLLKSGYLDARQIIILADTSKLYAHLIKTMVYCVNIDFHPLSKYNLKYKEQEFVPHERIMMFLEAAIYYDFNLAAVMRFVGNNYTAAYRNVSEIMQDLHGVVDD